MITKSGLILLAHVVKNSIFSRAAFEANAEPHIKKLLPKSHRTVLDGLEVAFKGEFGTVDYEADGERWYLYPVCPKWCLYDVPETESNKIEQMTLF